jgi:hypothetical protein
MDKKNSNIYDYICDRRKDNFIAPCPCTTPWIRIVVVLGVGCGCSRSYPRHCVKMSGQFDAPVSLHPRKEHSTRWASETVCREIKRSIDIVFYSFYWSILHSVSRQVYACLCMSVLISDSKWSIGSRSYWTVSVNHSFQEQLQLLPKLCSEMDEAMLVTVWYWRNAVVPSHALSLQLRRHCAHSWRMDFHFTVAGVQVLWRYWFVLTFVLSRAMCSVQIV